MMLLAGRGPGGDALSLRPMEQQRIIVRSVDFHPFNKPAAGKLRRQCTGRQVGGLGIGRWDCARDGR